MPIKHLDSEKSIVLLSYSSYSLWKQCPRKYQREKLLRERMPQYDKSFTIPGTVVHNAAKAYLDSGNDSIFNPDVIKSGVIKHSTDTGVDLAKAYGSIDKCVDLAEKCAENLYRLLLSRGILEKEHIYEKFFGTWEDPLMLSPNMGTIGAPDLIEINENHSAILYDYKATWSDKNLNKEQLLIYSIASERKFNVEISMASLFLLPKNKHVYFRFSTEDKQGMINTLQQAADDILASKFDATPNEKCKWCQYVDDCPESKNFKPKAPEHIDISSFPGLGDISL